MLGSFLERRKKPSAFRIGSNFKSSYYEIDSFTIRCYERFPKPLGPPKHQYDLRCVHTVKQGTDKCSFQLSFIDGSELSLRARDPELVEAWLAVLYVHQRPRAEFSSADGYLDTIPVPLVMHGAMVACMKLLHEKGGIEKEGIFRESSDHSAKAEVLKEVMRGGRVPERFWEDPSGNPHAMITQRDLEQAVLRAMDILTNCDLVVVGDILKSLLCQLPETILTNELYPRFLPAGVKAQTMPSPQLTASIAQRLPDSNFALLRDLSNLLAEIVSHQSVTRMNVSNLATCFAPDMIPRGDGGPAQAIFEQIKTFPLLLSRFVNQKDTIFPFSRQWHFRAPLVMKRSASIRLAPGSSHTHVPSASGNVDGGAGANGVVDSSSRHQQQRRQEEKKVDPRTLSREELEQSFLAVQEEHALLQTQYQQESVFIASEMSSLKRRIAQLEQTEANQIADQLRAELLRTQTERDELRKHFSLSHVPSSHLLLQSSSDEEEPEDELEVTARRDDAMALVPAVQSSHKYNFIRRNQDRVARVYKQVRFDPEDHVGLLSPMQVLDHGDSFHFSSYMNTTVDGEPIKEEIRLRDLRTRIADRELEDEFWQQRHDFWRRRPQLRGRQPTTPQQL